MSVLLPNLLPETLDWRARGNCRDFDPDLWWDDDPNHARSKLAIAICEACPIQAMCLDHALTWPETDGIWGGLTASQRKVILRDRRRRAAKAVA